VSAQDATESEPVANGDWERVCGVDEVPVDDVRRFEVPGRPPIAVFNVAGRFYATDDCCTHMEASLAEGTLDGDVVECPFHGGRFHIPTGEVVSRPPTRALGTHAVQVVDDTVFVRSVGSR